MNRRQIIVAVLFACATTPLRGAGKASSPIADAAMNGDMAAVRTLLQQKADVNAKQVDGSTALTWAVYRSDLATADLLIRSGADVNVANREGVTPLAVASLDGNAAMIERLIKAGADPKQRGENGETMVMMAARNGSADAIKVLVAAGADVNAKEGLRATTALMWASSQRHPQAVKALLELGADPNLKSGPAGLPRIRYEGHVDVPVVEAARQMRIRAAAAGRTYQEQRELEAKEAKRAPRRSNFGLVGGKEANDARGGNVDNTTAETKLPDDVVIAGLVGGGSGGLTALVFAAREGDLESAKVLLEGGADVNQTTEYGWTALLTATNNRNYKLGMYLVEHGANVNIANNGGLSALYVATDNRNIEGGDYPVPKPDMDSLEYIKFLLDHGADVNYHKLSENTMIRSNFTNQWFYESGATAFVRASQSTDIALMKLLLTYGADPKIPNDWGDTALAAAAGIGWIDGITYERSPKDTAEAVKLLLDLGLDPNTANQDGRTPLMGAAVKGRSDAVQLLVDHGARLETRDRGSRDSAVIGSDIAGHTWQALDYADGFARPAVQSAVPRPETAALIRKLMIERGLPVPAPNRTNFVCADVLCEQ